MSCFTLSRLLFRLILHVEKRIRGAAINTVKLWVPNFPPMEGMVREFALQILRKLQLRFSENREQPQKDDIMNGDEDHKDEVDNINSESKELQEEGQEGQSPMEDLVHTPYLPERIELPAQKSQVLQHVELLFALCVKVPEFLDKYVAAYYSVLSCFLYHSTEYLKPMSTWIRQCKKPFRT